MVIYVCHISYVSQNHIFSLRFVCVCVCACVHVELRIGYKYQFWTQTFVEPLLALWKRESTPDTYLFCINKRSLFFICLQ